MSHLFALASILALLYCTNAIADPGTAREQNWIWGDLRIDGVRWIFTTLRSSGELEGSLLVNTRELTGAIAQHEAAMTQMMRNCS
jgi:hypothetical protein